jgi:hypothetical protein
MAQQSFEIFRLQAIGVTWSLQCDPRNGGVDF